MKRDEKELAEAAASLTVEDFRYLEAHGMIPQPREEEPEPPRAVAPSRETAAGRRRKRRSLSREWPEAGTLLVADYHGVHYEAGVIPAPRHKSGSAVKVLTGPAAGKVFRSLSGAMLEATAQQRAEQGLGKKGVANGWAFWRPKEDAHA